MSKVGCILNSLSWQNWVDLRKHMEWNKSRAHVKGVVVALLAAENTSTDELHFQRSWCFTRSHFSRNVLLSFNFLLQKSNSTHTVPRCNTREAELLRLTQRLRLDDVHVSVQEQEWSKQHGSRPESGRCSTPTSSTRWRLRVGLPIQRYVKWEEVCDLTLQHSLSSCFMWAWVCM